MEKNGNELELDGNSSPGRIERELKRVLVECGVPRDKGHLAETAQALAQRIDNGCSNAYVAQIAKELRLTTETVLGGTAPDELQKVIEEMHIPTMKGNLDNGH